MGLSITLETESGDVLAMVPDDKNVLHRLLPAPGSSDEMLASVDWYGDTVFNNLQMRKFLSEWTDLTAKAATSDEQALLAEIRSLALRCRDEVHLYLKFTGD